jgi:hypothetical protein
MTDTLLRFVAIQLLICGWIGYAVIAVYRSKRNIDWLSPARLSFLHLALSPAAGLLTIYWISELTIPFPKWKILILAALLTSSTWMNVKYLRQQRISIVSVAIAFIFLGSFFLLMVLNGQDLLGISANDYFPRTNGDTFSYLSHMDQFRFQPLKLAPQLYPAGFSGYYGPFERNGVSALGAFFADGLSIESHVAFFSTLRLMLACILLCFLSILLLINSAPWIIAPCFLIYACGCFYLHSVLQQFFSATAGILAVMGTVFCCCLWIQSGYRRLEAFLVGTCLGLLLIYSPETFPQLFLALICFVLFTLADRCAKEKLISIPRTLLDIGAGAFAASLPLIFDPVYVFRSRLINLQNYQGLPYTDQEYLALGLHLVGLRSGLGWAGISNLESFILCFLALGILIGSSLLLARALMQILVSTQSWDGRKTALAYLSILAATWVAIQLLFVRQYLSYPLIKTMDYFNFLPGLILALGAEWLAGELNGIRKQLAAAGLLAFSGVFILAAVPAKNRIFSNYRSNTINGPSLSALLYPEPSDGSVTGIDPAVRGFSLDIFYYVNRWRRTPLKVYSADQVGNWGSYRYLQGPNIVLRISHRFCLAQRWNAPGVQEDCDSSHGSALIPLSELVRPER